MLMRECIHVYTIASSMYTHKINTGIIAHQVYICPHNAIQNRLFESDFCECVCI